MKKSYHVVRERRIERNENGNHYIFIEQRNMGGHVFDVVFYKWVQDEPATAAENFIPQDSKMMPKNHEDWLHDDEGDLKDGVVFYVIIGIVVLCGALCFVFFSIPLILGGGQ